MLVDFSNYISPHNTIIVAEIIETITIKLDLSNFIDSLLLYFFYYYNK